MADEIDIADRLVEAMSECTEYLEVPWTVCRGSDEPKAIVQSKFGATEPMIVDAPWILCKILKQSKSCEIFSFLSAFIQIILIGVAGIITPPFKVLLRLGEELAKSLKPAKNWRNTTEAERIQDLRKRPW